MTRIALCLLAASSFLTACPSRDGPRASTHLVIMVMTDGLRWQEVFQGADATYLADPKGDFAGLEEAKKRFLAPTPAESRQKLLPFLWGEVAAKGAILGSPDKGSVVKVRNGMNFSYPGYNEALTGHADPGITSNDPVPNPNVTFLDHFASQAASLERVAAVASWDVMDAIIHRRSAKLTVLGGKRPPDIPTAGPRVPMLRRLLAETPSPWGNVQFDSFTQEEALLLLEDTPLKILFVSFGETDEWAHQGDYKNYLAAAHRVDSYLKALWETAQSLKAYHGRTTLMVTTDHGRGATRDTWSSHGRKLPESDRIWMAAMGPDTPALGEVAQHEAWLDQVPATVFRFLGRDYAAFAPQAAPPITVLAGGAR